MLASHLQGHETILITCVMIPLFTGSWVARGYLHVVRLTTPICQFEIWRVQNKTKFYPSELEPAFGLISLTESVQMEPGKQNAADMFFVRHHHSPV